MIKHLLVCMVFLIPIFALAQGGGHVGRQRQQQQQQQQTFRATKYSIVRGDKARALYEDLLLAGLPESDRSESCSKPVKVLTGVVHSKVTTCFDRGDEFSGSRFKCYIQEEHHYFSKMRANFVSKHVKAPGFCGGDGIEDLREE